MTPEFHESGAALLSLGGGSAGAWLMATLLLSIRLTVAFAMSPALSSHGVPAMVRVVLVFVLAALSQPALSPAAVIRIDSPDALVTAAAAEVFVGMLLGLGVHVVLAAFAIAGRMLDVQIGFGIGSVFDPVSRSSQNVMGSLMSLVGVTLFFVTDAHLALALMLSKSTSLFPLGQFPVFSDPMKLLSAAGGMYAMGLALAAPVGMALVITDLFVGVASRNMPQINVLVLSMPLKVLIAYFVLAVSVRAWAPITGQMFGVVGDVLGVR